MRSLIASRTRAPRPGRRWPVLALLATACFPASASADYIVGTLSTSVGDSIPSADLAAWINDSIAPTKAQQLDVLTECFGGNTAQAFPNTLKSTAVLSATSPGQLATYGGYDLGAAMALKPGAANTGATVQAAGVAAAKSGETPISAGGLAPGAFSLQSTAAAGAVQSREVLVYAGAPDGAAGTTDAGLRDIIAKNFKGELAINVRTIGGTDGAGGGAAGWTSEGSAAGLKSTIAAAGAAIAAAANPAKEQFVLYATDHGGLTNVAKGLNRSAPTTANTAPTPNASVLVNDSSMNPAGTVFVNLVKNFVSFTKLDAPPGNINHNAPGGGSIPPPPTSPVASSPVFSILVPFSNNAALTPADDLRPNALGGNASWLLDLVKPGGDVSKPADIIATLVDSFQQTYNPAGGNAFNAAADLTKDSGIRVSFQLPGQPGDNDAFDKLFYNQTFDVYLANGTGTDYRVGEFAQAAPQVAPVPEPASITLLSIPLALMLVKASRHRRPIACGPA